MTSAVVNLEVARMRHETRRARRVVNHLRWTHGITWPTEAVGLLAHRPPHHLTDDERWFLGQITPARRTACAAVWAEYGSHRCEGEGRAEVSPPTPPTETRPLSSVADASQVLFATIPIFPTIPGGSRRV